MSNSCNNSSFSQSCEIEVLPSVLADKVDKSTRDFPVIPEMLLNLWLDMVAQILDLLLLPDSPASKCCDDLCETGSPLAMQFSILGGVQQFPFVWGRNLCFVVGWLSWTSHQWCYPSQWGGCHPVTQMCTLNGCLGVKVSCVCSENMQVLMTIGITTVPHFVPGSSDREELNFKVNFCGPFSSL